MTIYTKPRLKLTPAEERAADVMNWVHDEIHFWETNITSGLDVGPSLLVAVALLEKQASLGVRAGTQEPAPHWLNMHDAVV